jgi:hypothetical protein
VCVCLGSERWRRWEKREETGCLRERVVGDKYRVRELTERMVCLGSECWERWKRCEVSGCLCVMREGEGEG